MANEFYVRKGLAIATASVATASGPTQATKYLVVGDDNIVRWATASVTSGVSGSNGSNGTSGTSGTSGTRGTSGTSGTSGVNGVNGAQGESAGIPYTFSTSSQQSDPTPGNLKFIGSNTLLSTSQIYIAYLDSNGNNRGTFLRQMTSGTLVLKSNANSGTNFATFTVTGLTDNFVISSPGTSYVILAIDTLTFPPTGDWLLSSTDSIVVSFSKSGTSGTSGTRGTSGTTGTSGTSGLTADMTRSSTTSNVLGTGTKTFTFTVNSSNLGWVVGTRLRAYSTATQYMDGAVTAVSSSSVTISADFVVGSGTLTSWSLFIVGNTGTSGTSGTGGTSGTSGINGLPGSNGTAGTSGTSGLLVLSGTTNNGVITLNGSQPNGSVESNLTFDGTTNTLTLTGSLVLNTATASSGVFSHYFQVTVNGVLLKIPLYY